MVWERGLRLGPLDFKVCITVCSPLLLPSSGEGVGFCECSQTWGSRTMAVSALGMHLPGGSPVLTWLSTPCSLSALDWCGPSWVEPDRERRLGRCHGCVLSLQPPVLRLLPDTRQLKLLSRADIPSCSVPQFPQAHFPSFSVRAGVSARWSA